MFGRGQLMISVDRASFSTLDKSLTEFLSKKLSGVKLENMSTIDDRVSLHYIYKKKPDYNWGAFTGELDRLTGSAKIEFFIN